MQTEVRKRLPYYGVMAEEITLLAVKTPIMLLNRVGAASLPSCECQKILPAGDPQFDPRDHVRGTQDSRSNTLVTVGQIPSARRVAHSKILLAPLETKGVEANMIKSAKISIEALIGLSNNIAKLPRE